MGTRAQTVYLGRMHTQSLIPSALILAFIAGGMVASPARGGDEPPATQPADSTTYTDPQYKFSLTYSSDWAPPEKISPALRLVLHWESPDQPEQEGVLSSSLGNNILDNSARPALKSP
jgi:hypothetical protein